MAGPFVKLASIEEHPAGEEVWVNASTIAYIAPEGKDPEAARIFFVVPNYESGGYALSLTVRGTPGAIVAAIGQAEMDDARRMASATGSSAVTGGQGAPMTMQTDVEGGES
ncbi:MAG TPA: hypothetical protein VFB89_10070 [Gemmatimonadales bacterium]|nr:hypothetical protein [Gemmatimonadales bacterium]HZO31103.1 hypothetical protein [Chloroflexota bacterium]